MKRFFPLKRNIRMRMFGLRESSRHCLIVLVCMNFSLDEITVMRFGI
jgi:hypothetical protein